MPIVGAGECGDIPSFGALDNPTDMNASGEVVFVGSQPTGVFRWNRGTVTRLPIFVNNSTFSLNNAGDILANAEEGGIYLISRRGRVTKVAEADGNPSLSDAGHMAFSNRFGLFIVDGGVVHPLLQVDEPFMGSALATVDIERHSINAQGQILFSLSLADGRRAVVLAEPQ
jgi:hypothetical protein